MSGLPPIDYQQPASPQRKGTPAWAIVLVIFGVLGLGCCVLGGAVLFPVFRQARNAARSTMRLSETKQIVLSALMFQGDHEERFLSTDKPTEIPSQLKQYLKGGMDLATKLPNYRWNPKLAGHKSFELTNPGEVWYCETGPDDLHNVYVAFADGHARKVHEDQAASVQATRPVFEKQKN